MSPNTPWPVYKPHKPIEAFLEVSTGRVSVDEICLATNLITYPKTCPLSPAAQQAFEG